MATATEKPASSLAAWSAVGALAYVLTVWIATILLQGEGLGAIFAAILGSPKLAAILGLGTVFAAAVIGFSSRKRPFTVRTLRNFLIRDAIAIAAFLLTVWGFSALVKTGTMTPSVWAAAVTGATIVVVALLGSLAVAGAHAGTDLIDDEAAVEEMRERARLLIYSFGSMTASGGLLMVLTLAGPGGPISPSIALAAGLALAAMVTLLTFAVWRRMDELDRTLSHEASTIALYLMLILGGGWTMLAHLGFAQGAAPLDWLTLLVVLMFAGSFIAMGRRKLLTR